MFRVPIVATLNFSTANLAMLETDDWLSKPGNRVLVQYTGWGGSAEGAPASSG